MAKKTFAKLCKLNEMYVDDAHWQAQVQEEFGDNVGYTLASEEAEDVVLRDFAANELEFVGEDEGIVMFDIIGRGKQNSFFERDETLYRDKATGNYWALDCDALYEC